MEKQYNTDDLMLSTFRCLKTDMRTSLNMKEACESKFFSAEDLVEIRSRQLALSEGMSPYYYKWCTQVNSYLKRYTFEKDQISPQQREVLTNAKFNLLQEALAASYSRPRTLRCHEVIRLTRKIVRGILSKVSLAEAEQASGRFGTKATLGCPAADAYIDCKLLEKPVTGSAAHLLWFKNDVLPNDKLLDSIISRNKHGFLEAQHLKQVNVPKKYNIDRGINPNTLIGSLYTDLLGKLITEALKIEGLNIRYLQAKHARLAKRASYYNPRFVKDKDLATADLSDASHGFLSHILNALLPRVWYNACMRGAIRQVEVAGSVSRLESIMTMGIGFTFPMQTLLFYGLLRSISILTGVHGEISVYGDDLIYPVKMHRFVVGIFQDLGFKLNLDKTFVHSKFKESCGSDFFGGVDVRPYSMEGSKSDVSSLRQYLAFCYKLVNGLLFRWDYTEVQTTVDFILLEISTVYGELFVVESNHPETAGIRIDRIPREALQPFPVAPWTYQHDLWTYTYPILTPLIPRRYVLEHDPYYWDTLRQNHTRDFDWNCILQLPEVMGTSVFRWRRERTRSRIVASVKVRKGTWMASVAMKAAGDVTRYQVRPPDDATHRMEYSQ